MNFIARFFAKVFPTESRELRTARVLATAIHARYYMDVAPDWKPLPDLLGVLSQISNMVAGLADKAWYESGRRAEANERIELLLRQCDERAALIEENNRLKVDCADWQASFDLRQKADIRALKTWQEITGRKLEWPDHADLCVWLMEELRRVNGELSEWRDYCEALAEFASVPDKACSCHIAPPCSDCVDNSHARAALEAVANLHK